ncbi:MAG: glycosyltransferase WbuB [Gallionella sp.]|jgi:colanic acid biosynthesis glycosyl transferase WcaI|nr:glycosyltransferase WbuB [Gallionella sp.]
MRILINGTNYHPEKIGIGKYTGEMAEWLAMRGHEVRVVTAPPYYPEWRVGAGYSALGYRCESLSGVDVWRCPLWIPGKLSGLKRIVHLASFALSSLPVMLRQIFWRPDVVFVIEPPLMCAPAAWLTARLCGAKSWLHIQDFEVDAAFELGILRSTWARRFALGAESQLMRRFDRVSTISPRMLERLAEKKVALQNAYLFQNWVDTDFIFPMRAMSPFRDELGITPEKVVALYSGNMGEKQGLEIVIEAARLFADDERLVFVLCGEGGARRRLLERAAGLHNVLWLPLQPVERLNELLNLADVHLLPQRADVADLVMPSKLTGMLASGRPVVATAYLGTQVAEVVAKCGIVAPPGDAESLWAALRQLIESPEGRGRLGGAARKYAETRLGKDVVLGQFEQELFIAR